LGSASAYRHTDLPERKRPDTIRCIVASLIDDDDGELMGDDEGGIKPLDERDDTFDDYSDPHWMPEPVDAAPGAFVDSIAALSGSEVY
jgi:hypothetical protein